MPARDDDQMYFRERERQCLEMAACARDPAIQHIHRQMALAYARRVRAHEPREHAA